MGKIDVYYRAFREYRKVTKDHKECQSDLLLIRKANSDKDVLVATKYKVDIKEDWIEHIEEGLKFVEKAVAEERQFIRSDGEIVPIEKAKKVSRATVEHLAKHSNMITHVPENGKDIVPDKLYMVEKLSDYAVYENRFLYMLLMYLHEFIMYRLEKIEKAFGTYDGHLEVNKEVEFNNKKLKYDIKIDEHRENNAYSLKDNRVEKVLTRIRDCDQIINALLDTDLMVQVSKTPMIKPPITKTNVLKMNNNFKNALALYDYIAGYEGLGFETTEVTKKFHPLKEIAGLEVAECLNVTSFIGYKIGNEIEEILNTEYEAEEERRRQEEARKLVERIERIKKKARDNEQTLEEYLLALEERNKQLEKDSQELILVKNKVVELNKHIDELNLEILNLNDEITSLNKTIEQKNAEIEALNQKYIEDMAKLKRVHAEEMQNLTDEYENKINDIYEAHQEEIDGLNEKHQEEIDALNVEHENAMEDMQNAFQEERQSIIASYTNKIEGLNEQIEEVKKSKDDMEASYEDKLADLNSALKDQIDERNALVKDYEGKLKNLKDETDEIIEGEQRRNRILKREKDMMKAEVDAIRIENGKLNVGLEYATRERFNELEDEFMALNDFFKEQWKFTKKEIRKQILWQKKEKKKKVNSPVEEIGVEVSPVVQKQVLDKEKKESNSTEKSIEVEEENNQDDEEMN